MDRREAEAVLGASHLCTPKELAKCYRKKALLAHPDKGGSEAQFQRISDAYAALVAAYEASRSADAEPEATTHDDASRCSRRWLRDRRLLASEQRDL